MFENPKKINNLKKVCFEWTIGASICFGIHSMQYRIVVWTLATQIFRDNFKVENVSNKCANKINEIPMWCLVRQKYRWMIIKCCVERSQYQPMTARTVRKHFKGHTNISQVYDPMSCFGCLCRISENLSDVCRWFAWTAEKHLVQRNNDLVSATHPWIY